MLKQKKQSSRYENKSIKNVYHSMSGGLHRVQYSIDRSLSIANVHRDIFKTKNT